MSDLEFEKAPAGGLAIVADEIFNSLAAHFPVCMSSDEFHFFPQFKSEGHDWSSWDDFSPDGVADIARRIVSWRKTLCAAPQEQPAGELAVEIAVLDRILSTLLEQLQKVQPHRFQPTFCLTVAAVGIAEAVQSGRQQLDRRLQGLPRFLDQVLIDTPGIPNLFAQLGHEMIIKLRDWLTGLSKISNGTGPALAALDRLQSRLNRTEKKENFQLPPDLYAVIAKDHIGCGMSLRETREELQKEIDETEEILTREALAASPRATWPEVIARLPRPATGPEGLIGLYREAIEQLGAHCADMRFLPRALLTSCPVEVTPVPEYLTPVRSAAAYSMPPGHPPAGGTFYITEAGDAQEAPLDFRLLAAHETFPGHHLLDLSRWSLTRTIRRHIELPIFYEGWASFSEEILFDTRFFSGATDRMLMAKRRYWRAIRGMTDLDLHSGKRSLTEAIDFLKEAGMTRQAAAAMARRYALKPGYQLCYTIGRRKFKDLYGRFLDSGQTTTDFVTSVLSVGEIGFDHLLQSIMNKAVE